MKNNIDYLVSVRCFTFNHAPYIEDTLNGFVLQETNFPYVCIIVDDASTDGEPNVIKRYLESHFCTESNDSTVHEDTNDYDYYFTQHPFNKNCYFAVYLLKNNHYGSNEKEERKYSYFSQFFDDVKYHAICEGDDYWIYPKKLQKQVDFMENHPEYSMCFHNAVLFFDDSPKPPKLFNSIEENKEITLESLITQWIVPTASMLYRSSCLPLYPVKERIVSGDWWRILHFAGCGKVWAFKDVMSMYRMTYFSDSETSRNKNNGAFMCYQRHHILDCFDEYTQFKYHDIVGKYSKFWYDYSVFTRRKNKSLLWAVLSMPIFSLKKILKKSL